MRRLQHHQGEDPRSTENSRISEESNLYSGFNAINTATLTCKELETSSHTVMVVMDAAIYEALKGDPHFSSFSPAVLSAEDGACAKHPDAKVIDALKADK